LILRTCLLYSAILIPPTLRPLSVPVLWPRARAPRYFFPPRPHSPPHFCCHPMTARTYNHLYMIHQSTPTHAPIKIKNKRCPRFV
jgi:hypothetical protein